MESLLFTSIFAESQICSQTLRCLDFLIIELKLAVRACTTSLNRRAGKIDPRSFHNNWDCFFKGSSWLKVPTSALVGAFSVLRDCENFAKVRFQLYLIVRLNECADNQGLNYLWSRVRYQDYRV